MSVISKPIKYAVTQKIIDQVHWGDLVESLDVEIAKNYRDNGILDMDISRVTDSILQLKIKTNRSGTLYFNIKVVELM